MKQTEKIILFTLFGVVIYFPLFMHLDYGALYRWDESTNAFHAFEMLQNGKYLRRFSSGVAETWETKPPMLTWIQVLFVKLLGYNELAFRLPSALAALGTVVLIVRFFMKELNNLWGGIFSALVLLTSTGYVRGHVSRTGDHDALLIFFLIAGFIYFYKFLHGSEEHRKRCLIIFVVALICGVLTKSIAGLYFAPGLLFFTIFSKKFISTIKQGKFWLAVLAFFIAVGGYYGSAEYFYPGYLEAVWEMELFPRFFNNAKNHSYNQMPESFHFTKILFSKDFKWYIYLLPISLLLVWFQKDTKVKSFTLILFIVALTFHISVSNGTYNSWYNAPVFPLLAMIVGIGLSIFFKAIKNHMALNRVKLAFLSFFFVATIFFLPYKEVIQEECYFNTKHKEWYQGDSYGDYFNSLEKSNPAFKDFFVYYEYNNRHFLLYESIFNQKKGYNIRSCGVGDIRNCPPEKSAQIGDKVIVCHHDIRKSLYDNFELKLLGNFRFCELFLVEGKKMNPIE